jgi:hypothetical protein
MTAIILTLRTCILIFSIPNLIFIYRRYLINLEIRKYVLKIKDCKYILTNFEYDI